MLGPRGNDWVKRHPGARAPRLRLLCLPHAGGSAAFFHDWAHRFGEDVEVLVARYPGRHERIADPPPTRMEDLADALAGALRDFLDVPLAVFGHSMGASVGYEVALRLLRLYGAPPTALLVSGRTPPQTRDVSLPDPGDAEAVLAEVRRLGGTDAGLLEDPDLRDLVLPAIVADFRVVAGYTPRPVVPLPCPVVAYVGDADPDIDAATMRGWAAATRGDFSLEVFPGDHFYLVDQREPLIRDIRSRLRPPAAGSTASAAADSQTFS